MQDGTLLAAIDLGSNSFRLEIGRLEQGQIHKVEYLKETVRLGNGLDEARNLSAAAMQRGWECLARFAERLAGFGSSQVRAVATQTLREARNRDQFLVQAHQILGFPIDVIAGREEARLIYQGVAHLLPQSDEQRLVVDIGGRSTELILGRQFDARVMESYRVGSVSWSMRFFARGEFSDEAFDQAEVAAKAVLEEAANAYAPPSWSVAYGASGTIGAVGDLLLAGNQGAGITRTGLDWLRRHLVDAGHAERLQLEGLKEERRAVIGGGVSILRAVFELLQIEQMQAAQGALRQGVLYDLLDREQEDTDIRSSTVRRLATKFGVEAAQATRVGQVACRLLRELRGTGADGTDLLRLERKLGWAAQLHEIGSRISHTDYHKHGAYILDNADAPGFAQPELHRLSQLVLGHRGKLRKLESALEDERLVHQLLCLRIAVILCHARRDPQLSGLQLRSAPGGAVLTLSREWALRYPQSSHLLREEAIAWQKTPLKLVLQEN